MADSKQRKAALAKADKLIAAICAGWAETGFSPRPISRDFLADALQCERDEAERECIRLNCNWCLAGNMPAFKAKTGEGWDWKHWVHLSEDEPCESSHFYELRRRRGEEG